MDMRKTEFKAKHEALAAAWKQRSTTLTDEARVSAPWINQDGQPRGRYHHCLPAEYAEHNLLPNVRSGAIDLFLELEIPWHAGIHDGPGNNLLSSQVQCVNALFPMISEPHKIRSAFGHMVDIAEVLEIEDGRNLTFEYIGPTDYFDESPTAQRSRGRPADPWVEVHQRRRRVPVPHVDRADRDRSGRVEVHGGLSGGH